jgi:hypothetical protein
MQVGHAGLQATFGEFCDRWSWGVRTLVQDGNVIARNLDLTAGVYYDAEQYASGTFKDLVSDGMGDPHLSDSQVEGMSWSQVGSDNPINDILHPDYSAQSWDQAGQDMASTWKNEGRDVANGPFGLVATAADATGQGQRLQDLENSAFGPAGQQQPQQGQ